MNFCGLAACSAMGVSAGSPRINRTGLGGHFLPLKHSNTSPRGRMTFSAERMLRIQLCER